MVLTPRSYTFQPLDYEVLFSNALLLRKSFGAPKTSKGKAGRKTVPMIEESPDIVEARRIARFLLDHIQNIHPSTNDNLIFQGQSVYDPLETVEWFHPLLQSGQPSGKSGKEVMVGPRISLLPGDKRTLPKVTLRLNIPDEADDESDLSSIED